MGEIILHVCNETALDSKLNLIQKKVIELFEATSEPQIVNSLSTSKFDDQCWSDTSDSDDYNVIYVHHSLEIESRTIKI